MAAPVKAIDLRRPQAEQTRVELTLGRIGESWRLHFRGERYIEALLDFLRSLGSRETLRSYAYAILEFFDWYQREHGRLVPPDGVRRADAIAFATWLREREYGLGRWRLEHDPQRRLDLAIYDVVAKSPGIDIDGIRSNVASLSSEFTAYHGTERYLVNEHPVHGNPGGLGRHLACLVKHRTLRRSPSVEEYRRSVGELVVEPPDEIFRYHVPAVTTPQGADRASSMASRLAALSSLWTYFIRSGAENVRGAEQPLLQHNIWIEPLKQARLQAPSHQAATRIRKTPNPELLFALLATTFYRTHGRSEHAVQAARATFWGQRVPAPTRPALQPTFKDLRDRALLLLLAQTGVRSKEVYRLRRSDVSGRPPAINILGKRGKRRVIGMPPVVLAALVELSSKIAQIAAHQARYGGFSRAEELLRPEAPLLPAVAYWGANAGQAEQGLTRPGITLMLRRRGVMAGVEPGDLDFAKIHPHGFRHLFIKTAIDAGTPINRVQAIVGHASVAQTGRYAEERQPEMLVAEPFRATAPTPPPLPPSALALAEPVARAREPSEEPITAPAPPKALGAPRAPPPERPKKPPEQAPMRPPEALAAAAMPAAPAVSRQRSAPAQARSAPAFDREVDLIVRRRMRPLSSKERRSVDKCREISDDALRNLCIIYDIHWGEEGNRQALFKSGGRPAMAANPSEPEDEDEFEETGLPSYETLMEEGEPSDDEELAEMERRMLALEQAPPAELYAEPGTVRTKQIYSGKLSGLSWWLGSQGRLEPAMPVMSPDQIGSCSASGEQSPVCLGLVELWRQWFVESVTKAEALVNWVREALDTAAQLQAAIDERGGGWVGSAAPWNETKYRGSYRSPEPREVFRQHLDDEVVAWFAAAAGQYRTSPGDPEEWRARTAVQKVEGEPPPPWYDEEDPVLALPFEERVEMLDWISALTGKLPQDTDARFSTARYHASRRDIAAWIDAMCRFDAKLGALREDERLMRQEGRRLERTHVSELLKKESVDGFPATLRAEFRRLQDDAKRTLREAARGAVADFDLFAAIKKRVAAGKRGALSAWYLGLVERYFGRAAADDASLKLVAKCGNVPLVDYRELFNVERGTIRHPHDYKRHFAERFGTHSECVARRIARDLWQMKKSSPDKVYLTRQQHMRLFVEVERTFKVPCTTAQDSELRMLRRFTDEPGAVYREWDKVQTAPGAAREQLTEAERQEEELQAEFEQERARMFAAEAAGKRFAENPPLSLPTPIHFLVALGI